ncbi:MAG: hypothetical protein ACYC9Z_16200 [Casimicrobiaceae bacterium]
MIARIFVLAAFVVASESAAYDQATHGFLTRDAYATSILASAVDAGDSSVLARLGLNGYSPFGGLDRYFEFITTAFGTKAYERHSQDYERRMLKSLKFELSNNPALVWTMFGAIREDDNPNEDPPTPQDIQPGLKRPLQHFFDPYFDRGLTAIGLSQIDIDVQRNPDWALGTRYSFTDPNRTAIPRRNGFSVVDAREAMFRALTLMTKADGAYADIAPGEDDATRQQWRQAYWATAFRALGDVLHLNQDMAQPQHTRNEPHSGKGCLFGVCLGGHTSVYERYINARALQTDTFKAESASSTPIRTTISPLSIAPYPTPTFARYADYWSTAQGSLSASGKGLADYSNRGFFTAQNNLGSTEYPLPVSNILAYNVKIVAPTRWDGSAPSNPAPSYVVHGAVPDKLLDTLATDVPLSSFGLWDQFLTSTSNLPGYTLNRVNYDAMANLLLPRAVAYSAGLINYFFRGRIDISLPDEGVYALTDHAGDEDFKVLRAKVRNVTPPFASVDGTAQRQDMNGGDLFAIVRYHRDLAYAKSLDTVVGIAPCAAVLSVIVETDPGASTDCRDGVETIVVSQPIVGVDLPSGSERLAEFKFTDAPIPLDATDVSLQVVYRGSLGSESDAVVVGTIDLSEPIYFTYQNATDYVRLGQAVYTRAAIDADPALLALVEPQTCVDYRQSPPHLRSDCLIPFTLDLDVSFGDLASPAASVTGLPPRRFVRLAYLGSAEPDAGSVVAKKASAPSVRLVARRHEESQKALLYQTGTCVPHDPFDIPPRRSQLEMVSATSFMYHLDELRPLRGINGWYSAACVYYGDLSAPGAPDDRAEAMAPLTPMSDEVIPYPLTIMPAYL